MMSETLPSLDINNSPVLVARLKKYASEGKLSDLQQVLRCIKHINKDVRQAATHAASNIIRENLISHYHEMEEAVRQKLGLLLESLDPRIIVD